MAAAFVSTSSAAVRRAVELDDIQGLVRFGYGRHTQASFILLRVRDRAAARAWLERVATRPSTAEGAIVASAKFLEPPPPSVLQVAGRMSPLLWIMAVGPHDSIFSPPVLVPSMVIISCTKV